MKGHPQDPVHGCRALGPPGHRCVWLSDAGQTERVIAVMEPPSRGRGPTLSAHGPRKARVLFKSVLEVQTWEVSQVKKWW